MVSWNIDGLDQHNLKRMTMAVVKTLYEKAVDIVFLQKVIPETFSYLGVKTAILRLCCELLCGYSAQKVPGLHGCGCPAQEGQGLHGQDQGCGSPDDFNTHLESTAEHTEETAHAVFWGGDRASYWQYLNFWRR